MTDLRREQADAQPAGVAAFDGERRQTPDLGLAGAFAEQFDSGLIQTGEMQIQPPDRAVLDAEGGVGAVVDQGLVRQVVEFHEAPMEDAGLAIDIEGDAQLAVDEPLVKRALSNLLGNAIRYADKDSRLCVRILREGEQGVRLWVENVGPAIEPEHLPRLFDRFFRADASRCELEKPHHGLGLSIVAAIARMHDGFPAAESSGGTTRVGFSLHGIDAAKPA